MHLARYGLAAGDLQDVIGTALGGEMVTTTVEGRERFGVTVRYPRDLRANPRQSPARFWCPPWAAPWFRWGRWPWVGNRPGAPHTYRERLADRAYIYVGYRGRDIGGYAKEARKAVNDQVKFPNGYHATWSGQFESMGQRGRENEDRGAGDPGRLFFCCLIGFAVGPRRLLSCSQFRSPWWAASG